MNWKYDASVQEHHLVYNKSILARILMIPRKYGGVKVTTLLSGIYYGSKRQARMEKHNQEWVAYRKKFKDKGSAELYIARKKTEVLNFINAREKEG